MLQSFFKFLMCFDLMTWCLDEKGLFDIWGLVNGFGLCLLIWIVCASNDELDFNV